MPTPNSTVDVHDQANNNNNRYMQSNTKDHKDNNYNNN